MARCGGEASMTKGEKGEPKERNWLEMQAQHSHPSVNTVTIRDRKTVEESEGLRTHGAS